MKRCPNCHQLIDGEAMYSTVTGIRHCGCYWNCDPMADVTCLNDAELGPNITEESDTTRGNES
jgi:hypothetical protein